MLRSCERFVGTHSTGDQVGPKENKADVQEDIILNLIMNDFNVLELFHNNFPPSNVMSSDVSFVNKFS